MTPLCIVLVMILLATTKCDKCDPDIPSRSLSKSILHDVALGRVSSSPPGRCGPGHYQDEHSNECKPCADGTFVTRQMSEENVLFSCKLCLIPGQNEVTAIPCNTTRDTTILCQPNYYRAEVNRSRCEWTCSLCGVCGVGTNTHLSDVAQPCGNYSNTICCKYEDMKTVNGTCVVKPTSTKVLTPATEMTTPPTPEQTKSSWIEGHGRDWSSSSTARNAAPRAVTRTDRYTTCVISLVYLSSVYIRGLLS
ncbi:unnamed protein product [Lymnaea stagnalis]|uniref:TNFR-Cys domain-containing protein n=1 Tax=Lymnaea stagnalis TaxID=6523 RepID=A0AAV2HUY0_LYMST